LESLFDRQSPIALAWPRDPRFGRALVHRLAVSFGVESRSAATLTITLLPDGR
jgi:hypothetical protein